MSRTPRRAVKRRPRVVVIGNHKGGSGKTTLTMHILVALLKEGKRVASFDMDRRQQTLSRYIENRRAWATQVGLPLELPRHCALAAEPGESEATLVKRFVDELKQVERSVDFVVFDTPAGDDHLSLLAHGMADTLITPINDSFVDLDAIMRVGPLQQFEPSCYAQTVAAARRGRRRCQPGDRLGCGSQSTGTGVEHHEPGDRRGARASGCAHRLSHRARSF